MFLIRRWLISDQLLPPQRTCSFQQCLLRHFQWDDRSTSDQLVHGHTVTESLMFALTRDLNFSESQCNWNPNGTHQQTQFNSMYVQTLFSSRRIVFQPALRRRLLHRNGTFVPPAPSTRLRRQVKTDFRRKSAVAGPFFHQSGWFQGVRRPKFRCGRSRQFDFSRCTPETGRFGRFSGPRGPKWSVHFWYLTQKEQCTGQAECTQVTLFPYKYWVFEEKMRFGPVSCKGENFWKWK